MDGAHFPFLFLFGILLTILFFANALGRAIKFPSIIFYILFGILFGHYIHEEEAVKAFGEIGIVVLFFYLGIEFNIERAFATAKKIWIVGAIDFFLGFGVIAIMMKVLGFDLYTTLLVGGVAYASSSAISSKIIIDNHRIANPETELILGLMVFEDIIAPVLLAVLAGMSSGEEMTFLAFTAILGKVIAVFAIVGATIFLFKDKLNVFIDRYLGEEILTLFSIGGVVLFAGFTKIIGLSEALGAFLMGMIIAESEKSIEVEKIMFPIRDIAVAVFFFVFGASISFSGVFEVK